MKGKSNGKIGIITYYQTDNYGANLQAFAMLQLFNGSALVKYNGKNISRRNYQKMIAFLKKSDSLMQCFSVVINSIYTRICFSLFRRKHLMFCNAEECTSFILGADQIWNTEINKGDLFFFKTFLMQKHLHMLLVLGITLFLNHMKCLLDRFLSEWILLVFVKLAEKEYLVTNYILILLRCGI